MSINLWTLALQAVNVAILIWLLSRIFWAPVAAAIAARQAATQATLDAAAATQAQADAALADATRARAGIAAERTAVLADAAADSEAARRREAAAAQAQADALLLAAATTAAAKAETDRALTERAAAQLALAVARKLLAGLDTAVVQDAFLARLVAGIGAMAPEDRAALVASDGGIEVVTPDALTPTGTADVTAAIATALGGKPMLHFVSDPALIAGSELRTPHFTLHNSWRADLEDVERALTHAA
ncbi:hypothetical protein ACOI1H_06145 [Loktanella sp. DJP18]|uniref:F0F1 ATP synthase subunit B family protein n=1 Tax=Loktanella sp. DJP18 TaxID=3409788 RepID=UPI003BB75B48